MHAAQSGNWEAFKTLVDAGANLHHLSRLADNMTKAANTVPALLHPRRPGDLT